MTCDEFERVLPELEGEHSLELESHMRSCSACAGLLADLNTISGQAMLLQSLEEPSPRVWEFLQNALKSEGLIRERTGFVPEFASGHALEDADHTGSCPECSMVLADLEAISQEAGLLRASDEPSPRVWNSIEIALRNEGLIRKPGFATRVARSVIPRWRLAWAMPAAAMAVLLLGTVLLQHGGQRQTIADSSFPTLGAVADSPTQVEERELIRVVGERAPALRSSYEADLKVIDAYIQDAEQSAKANPQDEVAQQYLMSAYDQRAMIYEMAMNRSIR
jgi:hypothetical protein